MADAHQVPITGIQVSTQGQRGHDGWPEVVHELFAAEETDPVLAAARGSRGEEVTRVGRRVQKTTRLH